LQWNDLVCPSLVTKKLMEKHYGYEIEVVEFFEWGIAYATPGQGRRGYSDVPDQFRGLGLLGPATAKSWKSSAVPPTG
jgi:hypothetical protein